MNIQNPYMSAARRSGEPLENKLKQGRFLSRKEGAKKDLLKWRLHYGDTPFGIVVEATTFQVKAWNTNSRAFYAWQCSLGNVCLSLMEWREAEDRSSSPVWLVKYKENGQSKEMAICADTKADASREFHKTAGVTARVVSITEDDELLMTLREQREEEGRAEQ